jgi:hypothetical protein
MKTLLQEGKKNLLYGMSRCFERWEDGTTEWLCHQCQNICEHVGQI